MVNISIIPTIKTGSTCTSQYKRIAVGGFSALEVPEGSPVLSELEMIERGYKPSPIPPKDLKKEIKVKIHRRLGVKVYYFP